MKWSKLKQRIEAGFADAARGRVEVWVTRYRAEHDQEGELWITVDNQRVFGMGAWAYFSRLYGGSDELRRQRGCLDYNDPDLAEGYHAAYDEVNDDLTRQGVQSRAGYLVDLFDYLNMSIDEILQSEIDRGHGHVRQAARPAMTQESGRLRRAGDCARVPPGPLHA